MKLMAKSILLVVPAAFAATDAFAECSNIVLNMQDKSSGREITTILDCHAASYTIPGATTMHFMEWKEGKLCQSIQNCGNVFFWKGAISVGANWLWGDSVTDFASRADSVNKRIQAAYDQTYTDDMVRGGGMFICAGVADWNQISADYALGRTAMTVATGSGDAKLGCGWLNGSFRDTDTYKQGRAFEYSKGTVKTTGRSETDTYMNGIHANFTLDFGQINRSCSLVKDFGCM